MRGSRSKRTPAGSQRPSRSRRPAASACRRSADLAGCAVALSGAIPSLFDDPLAAHHRLIGRWVAAQGTSADTLTRTQARRHIERVFDAAVLEVLAPIDLVDLRAVVLHGPDGDPPAIALICDSMGQLDLGWIETGDAPIAWRAAAYRAIETVLGRVLPVFGYQDLFDEISHYYWEGGTDDEAARESLLQYHDADEADFDELTLPSTMNARRPGWMIASNAGRPTSLPSQLRRSLRGLQKAHKALSAVRHERDAWAFNSQIIYDYLPGIEECSSLPPLTLVPFEHFARELDDVARHGMELGFMDVAGICALDDVERIDDWFSSLRLGAQFLLAVQDLIRLDPATL